MNNLPPEQLAQLTRKKLTNSKESCFGCDALVLITPLENPHGNERILFCGQNQFSPFAVHAKKFPAINLALPSVSNQIMKLVTCGCPVKQTVIGGGYFQFPINPQNTKFKNRKAVAQHMKERARHFMLRGKEGKKIAAHVYISESLENAANTLEETELEKIPVVNITDLGKL